MDPERSTSSTLDLKHHLRKCSQRQIDKVDCLMISKDGQELKCHSAVVFPASPVLAGLEDLPRVAGKFIIPIDADYWIVSMLLEWLYRRHIPWRGSFRNLRTLAELCHKLDIERTQPLLTADTRLHRARFCRVLSAAGWCRCERGHRYRHGGLRKSRRHHCYRAKLRPRLLRRRGRQNPPGLERLDRRCGAGCALRADEVRNALRASHRPQPEEGECEPLLRGSKLT